MWMKAVLSPFECVWNGDARISTSIANKKNQKTGQTDRRTDEGREGRIAASLYALYRIGGRGGMINVPRSTLVGNGKYKLHCKFGVWVSRVFVYSLVHQWTNLHEIRPRGHVLRRGVDLGPAVVGWTSFLTRRRRCLCLLLSARLGASSLFRSLLSLHLTTTSSSSSSFGVLPTFEPITTQFLARYVRLI